MMIERETFCEEFLASFAMAGTPSNPKYAKKTLDDAFSMPVNPYFSNEPSGLNRDYPCLLSTVWFYLYLVGRKECSVLA